MDQEEEIKNIEFGLMSSDYILKNSTCEIYSSKLSGPNTVYDSRMGAMNEHEICETCKEDSKTCVGHFGHIKLNCRLLNPMYYRLTLNILKCFCYSCSKLLMTEEKLHLTNVYRTNDISRFHAIIKSLDKVDICSFCGISQPKFIFSTQDKTIYMNFRIDNENNKVTISDDEIFKIFQNISTSDIQLLGLNPQKFHPKDLVMSYLPVLPPISRPYVIADGVMCDDDLTLQYVEIIKANANILKNITEMKRMRYIQMLKFRVRSLMDNSNEKQRVSNGRPLKGIKKRISGKDGLIRLNLMGKRVDKSARSVIGGDPTLPVDTIGIPRRIAHTLTYSIKANQYNIESLQKLVEEGEVNYVKRKVRNELIRINCNFATKSFLTDIQFGDCVFSKSGEFKFTIQKEYQKFKVKDFDIIYRDGKQIESDIHFKKKHFSLQLEDIVERKLRDGDVVLLNRQPTLHRGSCMSMKIKIIAGKTIRMSLAVTSSFNADFDGDEMNIFSPDDIESEQELRDLCSVENTLLSPQHSQANIVFVQDTILGCFAMTRKETQSCSIPKHVFMNIISSFINNYNLGESQNLSQSKFFTGYQYYYKVYDQIYSGRFLFSLLLPTDFCYRNDNDCDNIEPVLEIKNGKIITGACHKKDINKMISILYVEYGAERAKQFINQTQCLAIAYLFYTGFSIGIKDCIIESSNDFIQYEIRKSLMKANNININVKNPKIKEIYTKFNLLAARDLGLNLAKKQMKNDNALKFCVQSGAKGQIFNATQVCSLLGQQQLLGERIPFTMTNETRSLPHYPIDRTFIDDKLQYESRGFIFSSFLLGLNCREFFLHSLVGREGVTDTSMKTSTSGYIQRRMIKLTEDLFVNSDHTIRRNNNVIQFAYNSYINPANSILKNKKSIPLDMKRLVHRLNSSREINS